MDQNEYHYRKVIGSIGLSMLFFLIFLTAFQTVLTIASTVLSLIGTESPWATVFYELLYGAGYLACFMTPVAILRKLIKRNQIPYLPMRTTIRFSKYALLAIPLGVSIVFSAAYVNMALIDFFYIPDIMQVLAPSSEKLEAYEVILQFIVVCLVPGFCEEFLFRGAILTNCLPFGRSTAILISSLLFSLMHQNAQQFFYTFVAGIVLGVLYEMSGSIWPGVILHTVNNFISTAQGILPSDDAFLIELVIFFLGAISLVILLPRFFAKKKDLHDGVFGKTVEASEAYAIVPLPAARQRKLFWRPTMTIFVIISISEALLAILLVRIYGLLM